MKKIHVRIKPKLLSKCNAVHLQLLEKLLWVDLDPRCMPQFASEGMGF
jgi:hypothetical protein